MARSKYLSIFLQNPLDDMSFVLVNQNYVWSSGRDSGMHLYLKIPENFICLILCDGFWFVNIPFGFMAKF